MKFKVGDRVKKIDSPYAGKIGTIKGFDTGDYLVEFDDNIHGHGGHGKCTGKNGHCWWCKPHQLELIKPERKFKVGDIVAGIGKRYGITSEYMTKGRVTAVREDGKYINVEILEHKTMPSFVGHHYPSLESKYFKLVNEKPESIVIYQKNETVVAKNTATGEKAIAKCHPDDEFDFKTGATVAFDRLMGREVEKPKFLEKFEKGKTYVFDKTLLAMRHPEYKDNYVSWMNECDGKVVSVSHETHGNIGVFGMFPEWCREVVEKT